MRDSSGPEPGNQLMKKPGRKRLIKKLLFFTLPLLTLSIGITAAVLTWNNFGYFLDTIDRDYRSIIVGSANDIELYMENGRGDLQGLARILSATKLDPWRREMALKAFNQKGLSFMSVRLISVHGEVLASSGWMGGNAVLRDDPLFVKVLRGESVFSEILLTGESIPYVHLGVPVFHLGEVSWVLWGEQNLKAIWDVMERIRIGRTGQVYIMDLSGRVVVDRNIIPVLRSPPSTPPEVLGKLTSLDKTPLTWTEEQGKEKYYCLGCTIPSLGWVVVMRQTNEETYAYLYRNLRWAAIITLSVCLATILLGWYLIRQFLKPINQLHLQVRKIGEGDLDRKVDVESDDEIGDLSEAFNSMVDSLRCFIDREVNSARDLVHARNLALLGAASTKVTHEVGNLLSNITLCITMLRRQQLSERVGRSIELLEKEAERVKEFILNFLQFAKKPELSLRRVSIKAMAQDILDVNASQAEARGVAITLDWPDDLPAVMADARLIHQVLSNLVKNSLEVMEGEGTINIGGTVEDGWLRVVVEDSGPGMEQDVLERIFDPFFTTKGKRGTGLGLSICRTIMEAHRGTIECESTPGVRTVFILRLPVL